MVKKIVIIGAGGCARDTLDILDACNEDGKQYDVLGYIVDSNYGSPGIIVNDKPILGGFQWLAEHAGEVYAICAIGAPELRFRLVERSRRLGVRFCSVVHPNVSLTKWVTIGEGVTIAPGCILTNQIRIGKHVQINLDCTISHDGELNDFVTLSPGAHVSGNVVLSTGCLIGTGANIINRVRIGEWSIIGAGSTIIRDVPPNTVVVGVPGKVIKTRESGWHLESR